MPDLPSHTAHDAGARSFGKVIRLNFISREDVIADRNTIFVFGDNMERRGFGGQAAAMRGQPNSIGVPTKWAPSRGQKAYFTNNDLQNRSVCNAIAAAFLEIKNQLIAGHNVVIPSDGLGTGLAELPTRAPKIHAWICREIAELEACYGVAIDPVEWRDAHSA